MNASPIRASPAPERLPCNAPPAICRARNGFECACRQVAIEGVATAIPADVRRSCPPGRSFRGRSRGLSVTEDSCDVDDHLVGDAQTRGDIEQRKGAECGGSAGLPHVAATSSRAPFQAGRERASSFRDRPRARISRFASSSREPSLSTISSIDRRARNIGFD